MDTITCVYSDLYKKIKQLGTKILLKVKFIEEENSSGMLKVVPKAQAQTKTLILKQKYTGLHSHMYTEGKTSTHRRLQLLQL